MSWKRCPYCEHPFWTENEQQEYCCKSHRSSHGKGHKFNGAPYLGSVSGLTVRQRADQLARALKDQINAITYDLGGHTAEERNRLRAEADQWAKRGRTRVVGFNGGGPSE